MNTIVNNVAALAFIPKKTILSLRRRIHMYSFYHLLAFFMFYAVIGWCTEVIYKTTCTGKFVNRGFLNGPLCPIYGVGATIVILCLTPLQDNLLILYIGSVILTSALEYVTGLVLEKIFHQKWWDYSDEHFNIKGYICLKFSLAWGLACILVMRVIQPLVLLVFDKTPHTVKTVIFCIFYGLLIADMAITVSALAKVGLQLKIANDLDKLLNRVAETIGIPLSRSTLKGMEEIEESKEKFTEFQERASARAKTLEEKYNIYVNKARGKYGEAFNGTERLSFVHKRLEKAYPALDFRRIAHQSMAEKLDRIKTHLEEFTNNIGNMKM